MLTRDDVLRIAEEAGFGRLLPATGSIPACWHGQDIGRLEQFAAAAYAAGGIAELAQQAETERADANQAKIDALMFEHCPEEMTDEQKAKWAISQAVSNLPKPDLDALKAINGGEDLPCGK